MSMVKNENFKIVKGKDKLKLYKFHTGVANHYFCEDCGVYTHHNPRINPSMTGSTSVVLMESTLLISKKLKLMTAKIIL